MKDTFNLAEHRDANIYGIKLDYAYRPAIESSSSSARCRRSSPATRTSRRSTRRGAGAAVGLRPHGPRHRRVRPNRVHADGVGRAPHRRSLRRAQRAVRRHASQLSPRVRLNFYPVDVDDGLPVLRPAVHADEHRGPARRSRARRRAARSTKARVPERDDFFEGGAHPALPRPGRRRQALRVPQAQQSRASTTTRFPDRRSSPTSTSTQVRITGIEGVLEFRPDGPLSGYVNAALNHAYGIGHDHRRILPGRAAVDARVRPRSRSAAVDRRQRDVLAGPLLSERHGDLRLGPDQRRRSGRLRLLVSARVCSTSTRASTSTPSTIFNAGRGVHDRRRQTRCSSRRCTSRTLFNKMYLLKGAFFSGPSVGRPRSIQFRLKASF